MAKHIPFADTKKLTTFESGVHVRFRSAAYVPHHVRFGSGKNAKTEEVTNRAYLATTIARIMRVAGSKADLQYPNGQELHGIPLKNLGIWREQLPLIF